MMRVLYRHQFQFLQNFCEIFTKCPLEGEGVLIFSELANASNMSTFIRVLHCILVFCLSRDGTLGLGSWPNVDQAPAPGLAIFKSMALAPVKFLRFY